MPEFTLKQLEAFVFAAEYNSFTRAAEMLYLTQSTVSTHIHGLEQALGVPLFQRDVRKKIVLTEQGKQVYLAARDILSRCERLQDCRLEKPSVPLAIGASTVPAQCILPDLLSAFARQQPESRFLLKRGDSVQVHRMLQSGDIQVGFVGAVLDENTFLYHPIREDRLVLVTENTPKFQQSSSAIDLLLSEPFIAREEDSGTWRATAEWLYSREILPNQLHVLARMENPEAIRRAVAQGMGVSVLSSLMVEEDVEAGHLLSFELGQDGAWRTLYLAVMRNAPPDAVRDAFIDFSLHKAKSSH